MASFSALPGTLLHRQVGIEHALWRPLLQLDILLFRSLLPSQTYISRALFSQFAWYWTTFVSWVLCLAYSQKYLLKPDRCPFSHFFFWEFEEGPRKPQSYLATNFVYATFKNKNSHQTPKWGLTSRLLGWCGVMEQTQGCSAVCDPGFLYWKLLLMI